MGWSGTMPIEFYAPNYSRDGFFEGPMWLHRLQGFPNLALNSMEKSETMPIEFYAPNNLIDHVLAPLGLADS